MTVSSQMAPPEVLLMAGGEGRRLGALTSQTPKPMLPVAGKPVLQHLLEQLRDQGVDHVYISVRHLSKVIEDYFGDGRSLGLSIDYVEECQALDTAGAIGLLPPLSRPLLVVNGDVVTPIPVHAMSEHHRVHGAAMTVGSADQHLPIAYGLLECRWPDLVTVHEKPDLVFPVVAGVYLISPEAVAAVPRDTRLAMPDLISGLVTNGQRVVAFSLPGPWLDMGSPDTYARADQVSAFAKVAPLVQPQPTHAGAIRIESAAAHSPVAAPVAAPAMAPVAAPAAAPVTGPVAAPAAVRAVR